MRIHKSIKLTIWLGRLLAAALVVLAFALPSLVDWSMSMGHIGIRSAWAIGIGYYCCVPVVALALWNLDRLLRNIQNSLVFVRGNVRCISNVRWCCLSVSAICLPASVFYPPLVFLVAIMAFLTLVVGVLTSVMDAAVSIREENDLTI